FRDLANQRPDLLLVERFRNLGVLGQREGRKEEDERGCATHGHDVLYAVRTGKVPGRCLASATQSGQILTDRSHCLQAATVVPTLSRASLLWISEFAFRQF